MARFRKGLQAYAPSFVLLCFLWANQECSCLPHTVPVVLHPELQATGSKYPLSTLSTHGSERSISPKEDANERLGGQVIAPWGRAAHVSWSPRKPQPARSTTTCCMWLRCSTSSSSGNTHATWSSCSWARAVCLQLQKSSDKWIGQIIEEANPLLPT